MVKIFKLSSLFTQVYSNTYLSFTGESSEIDHVIAITKDWEEITEINLIIIKYEMEQMIKSCHLGIWKEIVKDTWDSNNLGDHRPIEVNLMIRAKKPELKKVEKKVTRLKFSNKNNLKIYQEELNKVLSCEKS